MNKKFYETLKDKTKDFGLSAKAIEDLAEQGVKGLTEESSDEEIEKQADFMASIAKTMQGEVTRKMQGRQPKTDDVKGGSNDKDGSNEEPEWFTAYRKEQEAKFAELQSENEAIKQAKAISDRKAQIDATASKLGIPSFMISHMAIADDADVEKELTNFKQELVNNKLLPADAGGDKGTADGILKAEAEDWAKQLPDK